MCGAAWESGVMFGAQTMLNVAAAELRKMNSFHTPIEKVAHGGESEGFAAQARARRWAVSWRAVPSCFGRFR